MPERWHDINNPGKFRKPADEPPPKKPAKEEEPAAAKEPVKPEVRFISGTFEPHPTYGYAINKEAVVKGKAEFIIKTTLRRVTLALHAIYDGSDEDLQIAKKKYGTAEISDDGSFTFSGVPLYCHSKYPLANNKESINTAVHYKAIISHARHEKPLEITIDFPNSAGKSLQTLKRGMHDDKAHNAKPGKYPADPAQGYITGQSIHELQLTLEDYRYLPKGTADGAFGPKTEEAVKAFQADSLKKRRVSRNTGKLMDATSVSYKGQSTGEVESLTRNEMSTWKSEDFLRPLPELHHQDYDQEAVSKRIKPRGGSDFHEVGKPVMERQQDLQKADAYMGYALDGWYGDKMKEEVGLFQDAASKGKFIVNGAATEFEEKLTGFRRGVLDVFSQEYLKKVVEKGGKVPKAGKTIKKGDKGEIVEEINIRLAGFGGGVPADTFDDVTEMKVKNFQRDYMKMKTPNGVVDEETAKAIDEFGGKYYIAVDEFQSLHCSCGKACGGFGKGRHKNEYSKAGSKDEAYHEYEYPGVHRSLLWAVRALDYHLLIEKAFSARRLKFESGYRCADHSRQTKNHRGKAVDIHFQTLIDGKWVRPETGGVKEKTCNQIRSLCEKVFTLHATIDWYPARDKCFSMESAAAGATSWVHIDTRRFTSQYLADKFFCKNIAALNGLPLVKIMKGEQ